MNIMKNIKHRQSILCILVVSIITLSLLIFIVSVNHTDHLLFTDDIDDYNSEKYPNMAINFPDSIPAEADVVSFSYYDYWYEDRDVYLELKFKTLSEMENYLRSIKKECFEKSQNDKIVIDLDGTCFISEQNLYNESYVDMFCVIYNLSSQEKVYTGYEVENIENTLYIKCCLGVISYSTEELTVIHTYSNGSFFLRNNGHIPKYIERFNIPLDESHSKFIYLE